MDQRIKAFLLGLASFSLLDIFPLCKVTYSSVPNRVIFFSFECDLSSGSAQTVLVNQDGVRLPLLNWYNNTLIPSDESVQTCFNSAQVLTRALRENEGSVESMYLTYGRDSQESAYICVSLGYESGCTPENYLFWLIDTPTLNLQDALSSFTGRELTFLGNPRQDTQRQGFVDLQSWISSLSINGTDERNPASDANSIINNALTNDIETLAAQVTVRVITDSGVGSGTVVSRFQNGYLVATSNHVISDPRSSVQIMTHDGYTHLAQPISASTSSEIDLAILFFESEATYPELPIHTASSYHLDTVYSTGFANWVYLSDTSIQDSRGSGLESYRFTTGELAIVLAKPFSGGYMVGYSNTVEQGMSGGPVLDSNGNLVAINGRLQYPIQGINVYQFSDGTFPSLDLYSRMQALSWGIPASVLVPMLDSIHSN